MKSLRIILNSLNIGGAEKQLSQVLPLLAREGWKIKVITLQTTQERDLVSTMELSNIQVRLFPWRFNFKYLPNPFRQWLCDAFNLLRLFREFRSDRTSITHFFLPRSYVLGMCSAYLARLKAPKVMSRRSLNHYQRKHPLLRSLERKCHERVDFILGNSDAVINQLHREENVPFYKLRRIYNGIDINSYVNAETMRNWMRDQLKLREDEWVYIIIANLIPYKGHEDVLRALVDFRKSFLSPWRLICVGRDDGMLESLQNLGEELGLSSQIIWLGPRNDIPNLLSAADAALLCSHQEGFANAIIEAMAAGLPVIATNTGGNPEAVIHEQTGLIVPVGNPKLLSESMISLATDALRAKKMGRAGQKRVQDVFSMKECVMNTLKFYQDVNDYREKGYKTSCVA